MAMSSKMRTVLNAGRQFAIGLSLVLLMTFAWATGSWNSTANADSLGNSVKETVRELDQKGKSALDEVTGAGTSSTIEGTVNRATGKVQQESGETGASLKGAAKQAKGKAQQDIGTVQGKIEEVSEGIEDKSENLIDSIKDFFGDD